MQKKIKRFVRFAALALAAVLLLMSFTGCWLFEAADKDFAGNGMTITLTEDFVEKSVVGQTAVFQSTDVIVSVLKESFTEMGTSAYSVKEYADIVCQVNGLADAAVTEQDGYATFSYEKNVTGNDYYYCARTYKTGDAYWLIQFACFLDQKDAQAESFDKWAGSIRFDG